jgi:hypothetical protein
MRMKKILMYGLVLVAVLLSACSGDNEKPSLQFVFDGNKINLKGAKLYLTEQGNSGSGDHIYRRYAISDGEYTNGGIGKGWNLDNYTGATFLLGIRLNVPNGEQFAAAEFPLFVSSNLATENQNYGYVLFRSGEGDELVEYYHKDENEDHSPVIVSGGFEDGEKMTLKFSGKLTFKHKDPNSANWVEETVSGKFYFSGTVQDKLELN